jgi:hypothetical protein
MVDHPFTPFSGQMVRVGLFFFRQFLQRPVVIIGSAVAQPFITGVASRLLVGAFIFIGAWILIRHLISIVRC